jgi:hypothetical protein
MTFSEKILLGLSSDSRRHSQREGIPMKRSEAFIGLDVHKETIAVAIADAGRDGEVRFWGTMPNTTHYLGQLVTKLAKKHSRLEFTYEAGPCGYDIHRQLKAKGFPARSSRLRIFPGGLEIESRTTIATPSRSHGLLVLGN